MRTVKGVPQKKKKKKKKTNGDGIDRPVEEIR
jgi:hypothetical protein